MMMMTSSLEDILYIIATEDLALAKSSVAISSAHHRHHLKTNAETEGKGEDDDDPGDRRQEPTAESDASVNVFT